MKYYSAIKRNEILPFAATWMDLEDIMLSGTSQREKDKYCMVSLTMWNLKNKTSESNKKRYRLRNKTNYLLGGKRGRDKQGSVRELKRYKQLCIK